MATHHKQRRRGFAPRAAINPFASRRHIRADPATTCTECDWLLSRPLLLADESSIVDKFKFNAGGDEKENEREGREGR